MPGHPTDKANENLSPEKLNSSRQRRKITKEGPPSRAELEERKKMLNEYKRAREEKRRQGMSMRNRKIVVPKTTTETMPMESACSLVEAATATTESIDVDVPENPPTANEVVENPMTILAVVEKEDVVLAVDSGSVLVSVVEDMHETDIKVTESAVESAAELSHVAGQFLKEFIDNSVKVAQVQPETIEESHICARNPDIAEMHVATTPQLTEEIVPIEVDSVEKPTNEKTVIVPSWRGDEGFWLSNMVVIEYHDSKTDAIIIEPVGKPHLRLFKLGQIETRLACGQKQLAEAMLSVLCAPRQTKGNDPMIRDLVAARIARIKSRFGIEESADVLVEPEVGPEPTLPFPKPGHFFGSDSEQDETGSKLAMEVEEASRRHSIILSDLCVTPRSNHTGDLRSVQKAARFLAADEELMASVKKRMYTSTGAPSTETKACKTRRLDASSDGENKAGSTVKYALLTPSKRIQEMLQTDLVISPVRRSVRNFDHGEDDQQKQLYDGIGDIDMAEIGYLPNRSLPASPFKKTPKK